MDRGAEGMRCGEGVGFPLFHRREIWGGGCAAPQKKNEFYALKWHILLHSGFWRVIINIKDLVLHMFCRRKSKSHNTEIECMVLIWRTSITLIHISIQLLTNSEWATDHILHLGNDGVMAPPPPPWTCQCPTLSANRPTLTTDKLFRLPLTMRVALVLWKETYCVNRYDK